MWVLGIEPRALACFKYSLTEPHSCPHHLVFLSLLTGWVGWPVITIL